MSSSTITKDRYPCAAATPPPAERYDIPAKSFFADRGSSQWFICDMTPPGSRVLDIGCAAGSIAQFLREQRQCRVVGIEGNTDMALKARTYCEQVVIGDLESPDIFSDIKGPFDIIICADVLEHLRCPESTLLQAGKLLKPEGRLIVSLPNIANWRIRLQLLRGRFDYCDTGILDRTHLRFYTRRTAIELVQSCRFSIIAMRTTAGRGRWTARLLSMAAPELFAYQFIFKAIPCPASL